MRSQTTPAIWTFEFATETVVELRRWHRKPWEARTEPIGAWFLSVDGASGYRKMKNETKMTSPDVWAFVPVLEVGNALSGLMLQTRAPVLEATLHSDAAIFELQLCIHSRTMQWTVKLALLSVNAIWTSPEQRQRIYSHLNKKVCCRLIFRCLLRS